MIVVLLRAKDKQFSISDQQDYIINYALKYGIAIENTEIDNTPASEILEERETVLKILHAMKQKDMILIYDLWVLSPRIGELVKVFSCALKRDIDIHVCKRDFIVNNDVPLSVMIDILAQQRETNIKAGVVPLGRPKGSFSKSKFDKYQIDIVGMLEEGLSVSEIAKRLNVSRSSLKDYINSRALKEIVISQKTKKDISELKNAKLPDTKACPLIK